MKLSKAFTLFMSPLLVFPLLLFLDGSKADSAEQAPFIEFKTSNDIEVVAMQSRKVPLVTIVLCSKAGGMTEKASTNGLTHLWEHMFFKGNKRLPDQEAFNKRIRQLGIVYNGDTSAEKVRYYFTLPAAFLEEGLQFMADAIATPLLEQAELEKERRVVLDEYDRSAAQPSFDLNNLQRRIIYGELDYLRDPLGLRPIIETATREQLYAIKDEVFVPANSALLVSGDFDIEELKKLIEKHFAGWKTPKGWKAPTHPEFQPFPKSIDFVMTRPTVRNASVELTYKGPKARANPEDTFAADVMINLLNHRSGKFYQKFVDSGLTFGAGLGYYTQSQAGEVNLYASTDPAKAVEVKKLLEAEIAEWLKEDYFNETQLEDVRRSLLINHKREVNKPSAYIKTLAFWWSVTGLDYYSSYVKNLSKVGLKDVQSFVKTYLQGKPRIGTIFLSPEDAKAVGLKDDSEPLVKKHLKPYYDAKS